MKIVLLNLLLVTLATAKYVEIEQALENGLHPFSQEMVHLINKVNTTWKVRLISFSEFILISGLLKKT